MGRITFRLLLAAIIAACSALAGVWALVVPAFGEPDEYAHLDYAFALYDVGRPFVVRDAVAGTTVTPQVRYLEIVSRFRALRYNPQAREPHEYGSRTFLREVDAAAPPPSHRAPGPGSHMPYVMLGYPVGYYALVAAVMSSAAALTHGSIVAVFLAARGFNVALLVVTLLLAAAIFRRYRLDRPTVLMATTALGAFPLTTWVAGYVQPDNLSLLLVTATILCALWWREHPLRVARVAALSLVIAALFFTKHQYALGAWIAVIPFAAAQVFSRHRGSRAALVLTSIALIPLCAFAASLVVTPATHLSAMGSFVHASFLNAGAPRSRTAALPAFASGMLASVLDAYAGGSAQYSYWFYFGYRNAHVFPNAVLPVLRAVIVVLSLTTIVLCAAVERRLLLRVWRVARRRSTVGWRLATAGVDKNLYLALTLILLAAGATHAGGLELQGRYWLPVIVPAMVIVLVQLPKLVHRRASRRRFVHAAAALMASYSVIASVSALDAMRTDFYGPARGTPRRDTCARVVALQSAGAFARNVRATITLNARRPLVARGYAVDMITGFPATHVTLIVDGRRRYAAATRLASLALSQFLHDDAIRNSGFAVRVPAGTLTVGRHRLRFEIDDPELRSPLAIGSPLDVTVTPGA